MRVVGLGVVFFFYSFIFRSKLNGKQNVGEMSSSACALSYLVPILAMDRSVGAVLQLSAWCQWNEDASCTFLDRSRCYCFVGTCLRGVEVYWNCALLRN